MTDDIFRRLQAFRSARAGSFSPTFRNSFLQMLGEERWQSHRFNGEAADEDFPWMAALLSLGSGLSPDMPCVEMINDWIDEAYDHTDHDAICAACQIGRKTYHRTADSFLTAVD